MSLAAASCRTAPPPSVPTTLRAAIRSIGSLDPMAVSGTERSSSESLVERQVFEGLVAYEARTLKPVPALASSWTVSPDARTFTFVLRAGARFHSGRDVAPSDVVFSLSRLARAPCTSGPASTAPSYLLSLVVGYSEVAGACRGERLSGVTAVGPRTVSISLTEPWADFPSALGHLSASIVPADVVSKDEAAFARRPVGTGPYRLESPWDGRAVTLARFDSYWGPKAHVPSLEFVGYQEDAPAFFDLLQGKIQYAPVPPSRVGQARRRFGDEGFTRGVGLYFFGFNLRSGRVAPAAFREGLSLAVDRSSLADVVFEGTRDPARGLASPALPGAAGSSCRRVCGFDPVRARTRIAEAYPQGPPEITIGVSSEGANPQAAEALARMFAAVGVTARIVQRSFADHVKGLQAGDVDVFQLGWIPDYPALDGLYWPLFRSTAQDNYMHYGSPDVDRLLAEARRTVDDHARARILLDVENRLVRDLPIMPLLWYRATVALDPRLRALDKEDVVDGLGMTSFRRLAFVAARR